MSKNQLFRKIPHHNIVIKIMNIYGLEDFEDRHFFSRKDLENIKCIDYLNQNIKDLLSEYYLPCKARTYLNEINTKNAITILRQIVRLYDYNISSKEKYIKGDKFIIYQLVPIITKKYKPINIENQKENEHNCIVNFD